MNTVFVVCQDAQQSLQLRVAIEAGPDLRLVGVDTHQRRAAASIADRRPDVLVCALRAQDGPVLALLQGLRDRASTHRPKVLLVTPSAEDPRLVEALRAGGASYWVEAAGASVGLTVRLMQLLRSEAEMGSAVARAMLQEFERIERLPRRNDLATAVAPPELSAAERVLLAAVANGRSVAELAVEQYLTLRQVRARFFTIYAKLHREPRVGLWGLAA